MNCLECKNLKFNSDNVPYCISALVPGARTCKGFVGLTKEDKVDLVKLITYLELKLQYPVIGMDYCKAQQMLDWQKLLGKILKEM